VNFADTGGKNFMVEKIFEVFGYVAGDGENATFRKLIVVAASCVSCLLILWFLLGFIFGGGQSLGNVTGRVLVKGNPLERGNIVFYPTENEAKGNIGKIGEDGTYQMEVGYGDYRVVIDAKKMVWRNYLDVKGMVGGKGKQESGNELPEGLREVEPLVPVNYMDLQSSPLRVTVDSRSQVFDIDIPNEASTVALWQKLEAIVANKKERTSPAIYLRKQGEILGPYSVSRVTSYLKSSKITLADEASDSEDGPWLPVLRSPINIEP
jgi:hypothetical protein